MNICGIVAEYNPFHNGHLYQLQKAKELSNADYTIIIMGGNFMQRGTPAIMDKYTRAKVALSCGADLVIELPSYYSTGSAEYFALGAVSLLDKLGAVTHICFGSECGDINLMQKIAGVLSKESPEFRDCLNSHIRSGETYPSARTAALIKIAPELSADISVLNSPNNILGIEYIKNILKLNSSIIPITTKRYGSGYHDVRLGINQSSATALRQALWTGVKFSDLASQLPEQSFQILEDYFQNNELIHLNDFSEILYYKLLAERDNGFTDYVDVSQALSDRICNYLYQFDGYEAFCALLKTREITHSRISRCLYHILLNMRKTDLNNYINNLGITPYARVLGFRKDSAALLSELDKKTSIPLITKLADASQILDNAAHEMLKKDITINDIYSSIRASKGKVPMYNEYSTPIVIL